MRVCVFVCVWMGGGGGGGEVMQLRFPNHKIGNN